MGRGPRDPCGDASASACRDGLDGQAQFSSAARKPWKCCWSCSVEYHPVSDADIAERLFRLHTQPASWTMPDEHWSLGGQQEKIALAHLDGNWFEAHGSAATTHILKPGIKVLLHQALVEHVTMRAAARAGVMSGSDEDAEVRRRVGDRRRALRSPHHGRARRSSPSGGLLPNHWGAFLAPSTQVTRRAHAGRHGQVRPQGHDFTGRRYAGFGGLSELST